MKPVLKITDKGDPSDILQLFPKYNLQLLCCRYWRLRKWEFRELAFPYWRIYYNYQEGASINHKEQVYKLMPDKIYIIAPNTSYSSQLFNNNIPKEGYAFEGARITQTQSESQLQDKEVIDHFFIHFNIGIQYDNVSPKIFSFNLTEHLKEKITIITKQLKTNSAHFSFYSLLTIQALISNLLSEINEDYWGLLAKDNRILNVLNHIENNPGKDLSNKNLADISRLAINAFTRLFTEETDMSPQRFVRKKRIDKACVLLHHSDDSIDEIAVRTGFANRYHFTRIFTQHTGLSPAKYRKEFIIK